jgi:hypothetical protein
VQPEPAAAPNEDRPARAPWRAVLAAVAVTGVVMALVAPTVALRTEVLHEESSAQAGVNYPYGDRSGAAELSHVRLTRLTGTADELRIGPADFDYHHTVELGLRVPPRVEEVEWEHLQ